MIEVTVEFSNITAASSQNYAKVIVFTAVAGVNRYAAETSSSPPASPVPQLSRLVGKTISNTGGIFKAEFDGSDLLTSSVLATWDDTYFVIDSAVNVAGGEKIIIWYF